LFFIGASCIHVTPAPALAAASPYSNEHARSYTVSVRLEYQVTERVAMRLGYLYERTSTRDWALNGVEPGGLNCSANACVIDSGQSSPDANSHLVTWSMVYRFDPRLAR